jgi:hypothetical protein
MNHRSAHNHTEKAVPVTERSVVAQDEGSAAGGDQDPGAAARLAAQRASAADIAGLSGLQAQIAQAVGAGDLDPILSPNHQFHLAIDYEDVR